MHRILITASLIILLSSGAQAEMFTTENHSEITLYYQLPFHSNTNKALLGQRFGVAFSNSSLNIHRYNPTNQRHQQKQIPLFDIAYSGAGNTELRLNGVCLSSSPIKHLSEGGPSGLEFAGFFVLGLGVTYVALTNLDFFLEEDDTPKSQADCTGGTYYYDGRCI